jgi:hypothetical protein
LAANKYLWCDQVPFPTAVSDGRCDPENNVLGCWDGGDCCQNTCVDGELVLLVFFVRVVTHFSIVSSLSSLFSSLSSLLFSLPGTKYQCPLSTHRYPHCVANLFPGLDAEFYKDVSIGDVGTLIERTVVPDVWWPGDQGPMKYFNTSGIVKEWNHFYIRLSGFIHIPDAGQFTFYLAADDGATLYIDGKRVLGESKERERKKSKIFFFFFFCCTSPRCFHLLLFLLSSPPPPSPLLPPPQ